MFWLGLVAWLGLMLLAILVALLILSERGAGSYPGARLVSDHAIYGMLPRPYIRRDFSYRTSDDFTAVYNWYSTGLDLGPETRAQSGCILLEDIRTVWLVVQRYTSATICDTPSGRMMFVQRSLSLRAGQ